MDGAHLPTWLRMPPCSIHPPAYLNGQFSVVSLQGRRTRPSREVSARAHVCSPNSTGVTFCATGGQHADNTLFEHRPPHPAVPTKGCESIPPPGPKHRKPLQPTPALTKPDHVPGTRLARDRAPTCRPKCPRPAPAQRLPQALPPQ